MKGNRAAFRYAKAILSLASDKNVASEVNEDMSLIGRTIENNEELKTLLGSPVVQGSVKKETLSQIFTGVNGITAELFKVLQDNNRIKILGLVASSYNLLFDQLNGIQVARVTTAVPLTPALEEKIQNKVKELTGNEAKIVNLVDENIIGGFILRVGDLQINASVAHQLTNLKREFKNNTYVSKI